MLRSTGIPTPTDIESVFPDEERLRRGPVAVIECFERIPCNPCQTACRKGAIRPFADINNRPELDCDRCTGCALCVAKCPGLAIMVVELGWREDRALLKIPYEFRPLPGEGDIVMGLDRAGRPVAPVQVIKVLNMPLLDRTPIVSVAVDPAHIKTIRNIGGVGNA